MSLVRSFTKRARAHTRGTEETSLPRSCNVRYAPGTINRAKISLPTELLSTTNVHALNAPDIHKLSAESSSGSSAASVTSDNDFSSIDKGFLSADNSSSSDLSPVTPITPFSDMMQDPATKDFFSSKPLTTSAPSTPSSEPVPAIPTRAPSHSKKAHVELSRQRSFQRSMSPPPTDIAKPTQPSVRDTREIFSPKLSDPSPHPFGRELAKVDEVAERFGVQSLVLDEEENEMMAKGLQKFSVDDYLAEITGLTGGVYDDRLNINPWSY